MILMLKMIKMKVIKDAGVGDDNDGEDVSRPQGILNGGEVSLLSSMNTFYTLDDADAAATSAGADDADADDDADAAAGPSS